MPAGSAAVQVMGCVLPAKNTSVPLLGDVTATLGPALSIATLSGPAGMQNRGRLLQLRSLIDVIVIVPGPLAAVLFTARSNSSPASPVGPHVLLTIASSTTYVPPPLSVMWNDVGQPELRYAPSVMLEGPEHRLR